MCSKLTIKAPERRHCRCSGGFIVRFEQISHLFQVFLLFTFSLINNLLPYLNIAVIEEHSFLNRACETISDFSLVRL